jgi:hypothetical protein
MLTFQDAAVFLLHPGSPSVEVFLAAKIEAELVPTRNDLAHRTFSQGELVRPDVEHRQNEPETAIACFLLDHRFHHDQRLVQLLGEHVLVGAPHGMDVVPVIGQITGFDGEQPIPE